MPTSASVRASSRNYPLTPKQIRTRWKPSAMQSSYKTPHGLNSTEFIQIFVAAAWKTDELFRLASHSEQTLAKPDIDGRIGVAMHDEERRSHAADAPVGVKLIAHQQADWGDGK